MVSELDLYSTPPNWIKSDKFEGIFKIKWLFLKDIPLMNFSTINFTS